MNKKKVVACLLAATMTAGMLAGCGGSSGSSDSSSSSGGKDKLTFWFPTFASADGSDRRRILERENGCFRRREQLRSKRRDYSVG